jgi:transposase-like protein
MGDGSGPDGLAKKDGAKALSGAESVDTATTQLDKPSRTKNSIIEYKCQNTDCPHYSFQRDLLYKGRAPAIKEQIVDMSLNGSGIRDTARVLKLSPTTVINTLKKKSLYSPQ